MSDKIMNALCYVYHKIESSTLDNYICDFFYYWITDMLLKHLTGSLNYNKIMNLLYNFLDNTTESNVCYVHHLYKNDEKYFNVLKLMFDYSKDYNTYMEQRAQDNLPCNENYQKYIQNYVDSYNELYDKCKKKIMIKNIV
ncbi:CYIR protein, partial [Plasmodium cynomolgi strain B]